MKAGRLTRFRLVGGAGIPARALARALESGFQAQSGNSH